MFELTSKDFPKNESMKLIIKLEDSLIKMIDNNQHHFSKVKRINGYAFVINPYCGYADFWIRGGEIKGEQRTQYETWVKNASTGYWLMSREHSYLEWFSDYIYDTHEKLWETDRIKLDGWDQWIRICSAIALTGEGFFKVLQKYNYQFPQSSWRSRAYNMNHDILVPPGNESSMNDDFNYVEYLFTQSLAGKGKICLDTITSQHEWCIVPLN